MSSVARYTKPFLLLAHGARAGPKVVAAGAEFATQGRQGLIQSLLSYPCLRTQLGRNLLHHWRSASCPDVWGSEEWEIIPKAMKVAGGQCRDCGRG